MITMTKRRRDEGFSLIELLLVIVILGILTSVVVMTVWRMNDDAVEGACDADLRALKVAAETYFAQWSTDVIPDAGGSEGVEVTLVQVDVLRGTSEYYDVATTGEIVLDAGSPCTT